MSESVSVQSNLKSRDVVLDIVKGIGIICVILGHSLYVHTVTWRAIFSFHMPLFFVVSGMLFNPEKCGSFFGVARKVLRNLIVPYVIFSLIDIAVIVPNREELCSLPLRSFVLQILRGYGGPALWFLVAMAGVQLFAYVVNGGKNHGDTGNTECFIQTFSIIPCIPCLPWLRIYRLSLLILLALIGQVIWTFGDTEGIVHVIRRLPFGIGNIPCCGFFFSPRHVG